MRRSCTRRGFGFGVLCLLCPRTLDGADIALEIEGHISVLAAAIPCQVPVSKESRALVGLGILTGSADVWKAMVAN
jgi:hypothetical protein